jgi:hypothetical protein
LNEFQHLVFFLKSAQSYISFSIPYQISGNMSVFTGSVAKNSGSSNFLFVPPEAVVTLLHQIHQHNLKKYIMKTFLILPVLAILLASCSNSDTTSDPVADLSTKTNMVVQSDWVVTQYTDSGKDETTDYSGYKFKFNTDGTFVAVSSAATFNGTWNLAQGSNSPDDSGTNSTDDKLNKLTISITGNKQLDNLSHKWLADKITATEIWLRDDNVASNEILRFGK